jgi:hypothetical protein
MGSSSRESNGFQCYIFIGFPHASTATVPTFVGRIAEDHSTQAIQNSRVCGLCLLQAERLIGNGGLVPAMNAGAHPVISVWICCIKRNIHDRL